MDRHRSLYKENSSMLSPRQHKRINRDLHHANRAKQRKNNFQSGRNFEVSPNEKSPLHQVTVLQENKENAEVTPNASPAIAMMNKSRIALLANGAANAKKLSHKEAYLLRFMEWREAKKKNEESKKQEHKRPFITSGAGGGISGVAAVTANRVSGKCKDAKAVGANSFVPKNHKGFQPPVGLKNPALEKLKTAAQSSSNNGSLRKSLYTVVPTPPKKTKTEAQQQLPKRAPSERKVLAPAPRGITPARTLTTQAVAVSTKSAPSVATRKPSVAVVAGSSSAVAAGNKQPASSANVLNGEKKAVTARVLTYGASHTTNTAQSTARATAVDGAKKTLAKPRQPVFAAPAPPPPLKAGARIVKPVRSGIGKVCNKLGTASTTAGATGAVGKARLLQRKRDAQTTDTTTQRNAKLAVSFKAKNKRVPNGNTSTTLAAAVKRSGMPTKITINGKTLLAAPGKGPKATDIAETPTDLANLNPFAAFVTSTKVKSLSPRVNETLSGMGETLSPVKTMQPDEIAGTENKVAVVTGRMPSNNLSAKRALLQQDKRDNDKIKPQANAKKKFNFVRYSVGPTELEMSGVEPQEESVIEAAQRERPTKVTGGEFTTGEETVLKRTNETEAHESTLIQQRRIPDQKPLPSALPQSSPPKSSILPLRTPSPPKLPSNIGTDTDTERPANYLSPYVSVSRGKVSSRKEREKRNSVYLQHAKEEDLASTSLQSDTPSSVEARRTIETVRYFRQQLANEIERLHALCTKWEQYKDQELTRLQQNGGDDMINVTIGQTKLLTSKKFQQFNGLIDRCEAGARTLAAGRSIFTDGSENTKPITAVDLEGFWSMLGLQVENVEKRFENLDRWKSNDWCDPDEVTDKPKVKTKPALNKVKKPKANGKPAKASSALLQMLHQMQAEKRKNKAKTVSAAAAAEAATETEREQQQQMCEGTSLVSTPKNRRQRRSQSGTPRDSGKSGRISVVVRDRKMHSAAATVISIPAATATQRRHSRSSLTRKPSLDGTPQSQRMDVEELRRSIGKLQKACDRNELLRTVLIGATGDSEQKKRRKSSTPTFDSAEQKTQLSSPAAVVPVGRKSILKTPGTAKGKPKNVIFNDQLRVRKFQFTLQDEASDEDESEKQLKEGERIYSLRTRKVVLRPSSEFEIPK